jgi:hypothetical protein
MFLVMSTRVCVCALFVMTFDRHTLQVAFFFECCVFNPHLCTLQSERLEKTVVYVRPSYCFWSTIGACKIIHLVSSLSSSFNFVGFLFSLWLRPIHMIQVENLRPCTSSNPNSQLNITFFIPRVRFFQQRECFHDALHLISHFFEVVEW